MLLQNICITAGCSVFAFQLLCALMVLTRVTWVTCKPKSVTWILPVRSYLPPLLLLSPIFLPLTFFLRPLYLCVHPCIVPAPLIWWESYRPRCCSRQEICRGTGVRYQADDLWPMTGAPTYTDTWHLATAGPRVRVFMDKGASLVIFYACPVPPLPRRRPAALNSTFDPVDSKSCQGHSCIMSWFRSC